MNKEIRYIATELRADAESRVIEGYAITFNTDSQNLGGFIETIESGAVTPELIRKSDIKLLYNHNENSGIIARAKRGVGTMDISIDDKGVYFKTTVPNTSLGNDVLESIKRGDIDACSFAFNCIEGGDSWDKAGKTYKRTIKQFNELFDFSVVLTPAYQATTVSARCLDKVKELELQELLEIDSEAEQLEARKKASEFEVYYSKVVKQYLK